MDIVINCTGITDMRFPAQGLGDISAAGFHNVCVSANELYIGSFKNASDRFGTLCRQDVFDEASATLLKKADEKSLKISVLRSPEAPEKVTGYDPREAQKLAALNTIDLSGRYGCPYVMIQPLPDEKDRFELSDKNRRYYLSLSDKAKQNGVTLLIENSCNYFNGHFLRSEFSDAYKLTEFTDTLNKDSGDDIFGICLNSGNCNLCGIDMNEFCRTAGERIKAVVIRDNNGKTNSSCLPFTAIDRGECTEWLGLIRGLRYIGFDGTLIFDISGTAFAFPPLLRNQLLSLTASVSKYFIWQIDIENTLKKYSKRVLFGAGNMCNKYMNCYGKAYPPLFTCDNNSARWGDTICGIEIKDPAVLKNLPDGCAIFICNIYYREIEAQIREMGITNPVEYFNDEYLPSFPYEWLEV